MLKMLIDQPYWAFEKIIFVSGPLLPLLIWDERSFKWRLNKNKKMLIDQPN